MRTRSLSLMRAAACALALTSLVAAAQAPNALAYRATAGGETIDVRIDADGAVEFFDASTGTRVSARSFRTRAGLMGVLPNGVVYSLGDVRGSPRLGLGARLYTLTPIALTQFGKHRASAAAAAGTAEAPAPRGNTAVLGGLRLSSASSRNGYGQLRSYDFCSNGSYVYRFEELQSSQFGNASGERIDRGTWSVAGTSLQLRSAGGGGSSFSLQRIAADVIALDGRRYAVERSERCR